MNTNTGHARGASLVVVLGLGLGFLVPGQVAAQGAPEMAGLDAVIARYREQIPRLMAEHHVPGLALAVVDEEQVLWAEGFGHTSRGGTTAVTPQTLFSVQSTTKTVTATAALIAVQEGLLDLDEPITARLPSLSVNSLFEDHPERLITLRHLLAHTSGLPHEAPLGNNFDLGPVPVARHAASVSGTWLRFEVGRGYAYSNAGYGVAGRLLEAASGEPFARFVETRVLRPLGMDHSTFDPQRVRAVAGRALGHAPPLPRVPVEVPMVPAGGLYSTAEDMARFIRFHLDHGTVGGTRLLEPALLDDMTTVQFPEHDAAVGYGLGIARERHPEPPRYEVLVHGGGGFGFMSDMIWYPELGIGITVLANAVHGFQWTLATSILDDMVRLPDSPYSRRLATLAEQEPATRGDQLFVPPPDLARRIAEQALPANDAPQRWSRHEGTYMVRRWGRYTGTDRVFVRDGALHISAFDDPPGHAGHRLVEARPDVFFAGDGSVLDLSGPTPTWQSIALERVRTRPETWQLVVLGLSALVFASVLVVSPWRALRSWLRRNAAGAGPGSGAGLGRATAVLTALLGALGLAMLAALPFLLYSGFLGDLELPPPQRIGLHLPLFLLAAACVHLGLTWAGWRQGWWSPGERIHHTLLTLAAAALLLLFWSWNLIGWGWGA